MHLQLGLIFAGVRNCLTVLRARFYELDLQSVARAREDEKEVDINCRFITAFGKSVKGPSSSNQFTSKYRTSN
jgi:hypothetical protein